MEGKIFTMPIVALRGLTVLPKMMIHFDISREKSIAAVEKAMVDDQQIFLLTQRQPDDIDPDLGQLYQIGTVALIKQLVKLPNNVIRVMVEGKHRGELLSFDTTKPFLSGEVTVAEQIHDEIDPIASEAMVRVFQDKLSEYGREHPQLEKGVMPNLLLLTNLEELMDQIVIQLPWGYQIRQDYLEATYLSERYEKLLNHLMKEIDIIRIKQEFQKKVKASIDKNQKEYILREQMRIIREELGEDSPASEGQEYEQKLKNLKADAETKAKLKKEIDRFKAMPSSSQEANVLRTYIETLLELPWKKVSKDNRNLKKAEQILNDDHYGLDQVKERILEYLAVRTLTKKGTSPIICLVGPPGTGKTSIARSVARALNKEYVRISLGGVRDEAEIRGHRKTYIGAMPGRFAEGLRQAGVSNPLMLLDEIDKVSSDYKGDTASALLEVLDGEQNVKFRDHYVETPIDLSEVLFIATANTTQTIPGPLLDRMELIEVTSYTKNEKFHIAKDYLVNKQIEKNGLSDKAIEFSDDALKKIIHHYTRESGVRNLERRIGEICRKSAREFLQDEKEKIKITDENLYEYLGKEKYTFDSADEQDQTGIVRGLAWTSVGGDTLQIEVNITPGKGQLKLTGQMGDVMKESAQIALTYIRSQCPKYKVADNYFSKNDLHIHIPAGAVPKDGPSAGITMATAMLSAVIDRPVKAAVAMTGEITLRGRVLPIGGLKEKILAAKMANVKKVLVPERNRPDIDELSEEIVQGIEVSYVTHMDDVIKEAFA